MSELVVSAHQPNFLPYLGFFDKMKKSDIFVVRDEVLFTDSDFHHRNRIRINGNNNISEPKFKWLTVPIFNMQDHIMHIQIKKDAKIKKTFWNEQILHDLSASYNKSKYFDEIFPELERIFKNKHEKLLSLNMEIINFLMKVFNMKAKIVMASELGLKSLHYEKSDASEDLAKICNKVGADVYLSGPGGKGYLNLEPFEKYGIEVRFQEFEHPSYEQMYPGFISHLASIDYLFCSGKKLFQDSLYEDNAEIQMRTLNQENIAELIPQLIELEKNWTDIGEKAWTSENFSRELPGKWELSMCAFLNGKIVGYIIGSVDEKKAKLNKILVDKESRGKGIATILWNELLERCRKKELNAVEFKALAGNEPALEFYKKKNCLFYNYSMGDDKKLRYSIKYVFKTEKITHSKPTLDFSDMFAVSDSMKNGDISTGNVVRKFVSHISKYIGKKYGVATNSGTSALHLALRALDVKENDEVIMPSYICGSVINAVMYCRATPVIVDINEDDYNISLEETKKKINSKTKAIIVSHMFGSPVKDIEKFLELGIPIIEDCALSIGAEHNGRKTGSFGVISIFSFYATKLISTGFGGMALTDSEEIMEKLSDFTKYDNREEFGESYNYSMSDFQAAFGLSQLNKLDSFIKKRKKISEIYVELFKNSNSGFILPKIRENIFFRFIIKTDEIDSLIKNVRERGVEASKPVFKPIHSYLNLSDDNFPNTIKAYESSVSIPIYPSLSDEEVENTAGILINWKSEKEALK